MKWFSMPTYKRHQEDIKCYTRGVGRYYEWVIKLANSYNREYASIGILDINDLIQAGHVGLLQAWNGIEWDKIEASSNPEAQLWGYIKKRIKWAIRREIDKYSQHIALPINKLENMRNHQEYEDQIFCHLFPKFFDQAFPNLVDEPMPYWESEVLGEIIDDHLYANFKVVDHVEILRARYGIDREKPASAKELANKYRTTEAYIGQVINRMKNKLKKDDKFKEIIENFYIN